MPDTIAPIPGSHSSLIFAGGWKLVDIRLNTREKLTPYPDRASRPEAAGILPANVAEDIVLTLSPVSAADRNGHRILGSATREVKVSDIWNENSPLLPVLQQLAAMVQSEMAQPKK